MVHDAWWDSCDAPFIAGEISTGHGYEGTDEYSPIGSDRSDLILSDPAYGPSGRIAEFDAKSGEIVPATGVQFHVEQWSAERKVFTAESADQAELALHVVDYPAWAATVDGERHADKTRTGHRTDTSQIAVPAPHRVELRFQRTWDRVTGDAISVFSAIGLLGFAFMRKRQSSSPQIEN